MAARARQTTATAAAAAEGDESERASGPITDGSQSVSPNPTSTSFSGVLEYIYYETYLCQRRKKTLLKEREREANKDRDRHLYTFSLCRTGRVCKDYVSKSKGGVPPEAAQAPFIVQSYSTVLMTPIGPAFLCVSHACSYMRPAQTASTYSVVVDGA